MRFFENDIYNELHERIKRDSNSILDIQIDPDDITQLKYFLTRNFYYAVIVDDYLFDITDKESLLEAVYYQARLITVHSLNWDAFQEGLNDIVNDYWEFNGICLIFRNWELLSSKVSGELNFLAKIIDENNKISEKKIKIILNKKNGCL